MRCLSCCAFLVLTLPLAAQFAPDVDRSLKLTAITRATHTDLRWETDPAVLGYTVYRRPYGSADWGPARAQYPPTATGHRDGDVRPGRPYEYRVDKRTTSDRADGVGYLLTGYDLPPVHRFGGLLILVTSPTLAQIRDELARYRAALADDGWPSQLREVPAGADVRAVKDLILAAHRASPFTHLLLLDDVPIAYSGDISPDGHRDHRGAWASDLYYGDLDGHWTDSLVNNTTAADPVNHNVPGDGKWDQDALPSDLELAVGRVDFRRLPAITTDRYTLLRHYLRRNVAYRTAEWQPRRRAVVRNLNPWTGALGQSGIRAASALVGPSAISYTEWAEVFDASYLFYFGAGNGGFPGAIKNPNSFRFNKRNFGAVFTSWFSSYVGDYGLENCYLKAALSSGDVLTATFVGAPLVHQHALALGASVGETLRASQNNDGRRYVTGLFPRGVHLNLLGDPTLRSQIVPPPGELTAESAPDAVHLRWAAAADDRVDRYYLYRRSASDTLYTLLDSVAATGELAFVDRLRGPSGQPYDYRVRASRLEVTPAGSYRNLSAGRTASAVGTTAAAPGGEPERRAAGPAVTVFPNPARASFAVRSAEPIHRLAVLSADGRWVHHQRAGGARALRIALPGVAPGAYRLRVVTAGGAVWRSVLLRE